MITTDFLTLSGLCNDDFTIMARIIKDEMCRSGTRIKYAKVLADLNVDGFEETLMDKYNPAIIRVLARPISFIRSYTNTLFEIEEEDNTMSLDEMIAFIKVKGCSIVEFKLEKTLLYGCSMFMGCGVNGYVNTFDGETREEAVLSAFEYVMGL